MPTVTGKILRPDGTPPRGGHVRFTLSGADRAFLDPDETRVSGVGVAIDPDTGVYTATLPGNTDLRPTGTRWNRAVTADRVTAFNDNLLVPASGGPYDEEDILADPLDPIPEATPSNELDTVELAATFGPVTSGLLQLTPVPGMVVEVPDIARPCQVEAQGILRIADAAFPAGGAAVAIGLAAPSATDLSVTLMNGFAPVPAPVIGDAGSGVGLDVNVWTKVRIPANSPQELQVFIHANNNTSGFPASVPVSLMTADHIETRVTVLAV